MPCVENAPDPVAKALWFIENQFAGDISLAEIAHISGVSRFHLSRAFGLATGHSVMRYVRGRRLSEAARALAAGAPDILALALESGYGSHEAFTRAFRDCFGLTPEAFRARGTLEDIELMEPLKMDETLLTHLDPPRIEAGKTLLIAGLSERYNAESCAAIPAQWQRFGPYLGHIAGQVGGAAYGVVCNSDDAGNIEYITGVEVSDFTLVPRDFSRLRIGIGPVPEAWNAADFVLSRFSAAERPVIDETVLRAADGVECWAANGIEISMNQFNR